MNNLIPSFFGAIVFYTTFPLPQSLPLNLERIARWLSIIGLLIGFFLGLVNFVFSQMTIPILTRSVLIISIWLYITGGLHLDGLIDSADGLAVPEQKRRLEVMKDSFTGAFGVMAAVIVLLIKVVTLSEILYPAWLSLMIATSWARWGQLMAIAFYPYVRETGKGAFHKENLIFPQDCLFGSIFIPILITGQIYFTEQEWWLIILIQLACAAIALLVGFWFNRQLGGHTGDTYGAVVEWSEALILCLLTTVISS